MANDIIRPVELPPRANPVASEVVPSDNGSVVGGVTWTDGVNIGRPLANQAEAEAGVNATKAMTPLTTKQAIGAQVPSLISTAINNLNLGTASQQPTEAFATAAQGAKADTAMQPSMYDPNGNEADAFDSANHAYDNTDSGLASSTAQDAIDELADRDVVRVEDRTALKALDGAKTPAAIVYGEGGRNGVFAFVSGDQSALVTTDTLEGVYVAPASDDTGASGVWMRQYDGLLNVRWFGATGTYHIDTHDDTDAIIAALALAAHLNIRGIFVPPGIYGVSDQIVLPRGVGIYGVGFSVGTRWDKSIPGWSYTTGSEFAITHNPVTKTEDDATFLMTTGCTIKGVCFWYPGQPVHNITTFVEFAPTIGLYLDPDPLGTVFNTVVEECYTTNSYWFLSWTKRMGACRINNIVGALVFRGLLIDKSYDILNLNLVSFNPNHAYTGDWPSGSLLVASRDAGAIFLEMAKCDQPYIDQVFCYGGHIGLYLTNLGEGGLNGAKFGECGFEGCDRPLVVTGNLTYVDFGQLTVGPRGNSVYGAIEINGVFCSGLDFSRARVTRSYGAALYAYRVRGLNLSGFIVQNARGLSDVDRYVIHLEECSRVVANGMYLEIVGSATLISYLYLDRCRGFEFIGNYLRGCENARPWGAINAAQSGDIARNFQHSSSTAGALTQTGTITDVNIETLRTYAGI